MSLKSLAHFRRNYDVLACHRLADGSRKVFLTEVAPGTCAYCGQSSPEVSFRKTAHAVPELIGNKWLFSREECDDCNKTLAANSEDHLGKFLGLWRTASQVSGKGGVPQTGRSHRSHMRIDDEIVIHQLEDDPFADIDEERKEIRIAIERQPYVPAAVFKAFTKMAYSLMPLATRRAYPHLPAWLLEPEPRASGAGFQPLKLMHMFIPGPMPLPGIHVALLKQKPEVQSPKHCFFAISFANHSFQLALPELLGEETSTSIDLLFFPVQLWADPAYGAARGTVYDLSDEQIVRNELQKQTIQFESFSGPRVRRSPDAR